MAKLKVAFPEAAGAKQAATQEICRGRPKALSSEEQKMALGLYFDEGMPVRAIADALGVSHMTIWRTIAALPPPSAGADN